VGVEVRFGGFGTMPRELRTVRNDVRFGERELTRYIHHITNIPPLASRKTRCTEKLCVSRLELRNVVVY
jgi:hypothetical protein